jgi:hypothetical protein
MCRWRSGVLLQGPVAVLVEGQDDRVVVPIERRVEDRFHNQLFSRTDGKVHAGTNSATNVPAPSAGQGFLHAEREWLLEGHDGAAKHVEGRVGLRSNNPKGCVLDRGPRQACRQRTTLERQRNSLATLTPLTEALPPETPTPIFLDPILVPRPPRQPLVRRGGHTARKERPPSWKSAVAGARCLTW